MAVKGLVLYRELEPDLLSREAKEWLLRNEGSFERVENDRARSDVWTQEILGATAGFVLVTNDGDQVAEFDDLGEAEFARDNARIEVKMRVETPKPGSTIGRSPEAVTK